MGFFWNKTAGSYGGWGDGDSYIQCTCIVCKHAAIYCTCTGSQLQCYTKYRYTYIHVYICTYLAWAKIISSWLISGCSRQILFKCWSCNLWHVLTQRSHGKNPVQKTQGRRFSSHYAVGLFPFTCAYMFMYFIQTHDVVFHANTLCVYSIYTSLSMQATKVPISMYTCTCMQNT